MKVTEIFKTIQGEGTLTGVVSVIVRLWGCNLRCRWCDEKSSLKLDNCHKMSIDDIVKRVNGYNCGYVIITGGEPMIHEGIVALTRTLKNIGYHVTIETNATIRKDVFCDLISMSPKLSHSIPDQGFNYAISFFSQTIIRGPKKYCSNVHREKLAVCQ